MSEGIRFKSWLVILVLAFVGAGVTACGSGKRTGSSSIHTTTATTGDVPGRGAVKSDGDADNPRDIDGNPDVDTTDEDDDTRTPESYRYPDNDDKATLAFGHPPSLADRRAIIGVVRRYYAAAAQADGAVACALLDPNIASTVPESYGRGAGPPYLRGGKTCAAVMSRLFGHFRQELTGVARVLDVRVSGGIAQVVVGSERMPAGAIPLQRRGKSWKVMQLLGALLP